MQKKWKIDYRDNASNGELRTTYVVNERMTKEGVIEFLGLNRPDVQWYNIELVEQ